MRGVRSVGFIFYGNIFENNELAEAMGYSFDSWLDEILSSRGIIIEDEKKYWKDKDKLKKELGIEAIFYDGDNKTNVAIAVKDSLFTTCSGLADILNLDYFKVEKDWQNKLNNLYKLLSLENKVKPNWYFLTKTEI